MLHKLVAMIVMLFVSAPAIAPAETEWRCPCGVEVSAHGHAVCPFCNRRRRRHQEQVWDTVNDGTGLKLGVYVKWSGGTLFVTSVMQNSPAEGKLFRGDRLIRGAFQDPVSGQVHRVRLSNLADLQQLKMMAGPGTRVAMQVAHGRSVRALWVTFEVEYEAEATATSASAPAQETRIEEDVDGDASRMLEGEVPENLSPVDQGASQDPTLFHKPATNPEELLGEL